MGVKHRSIRWLAIAAVIMSFLADVRSQSAASPKPSPSVSSAATTTTTTKPSSSPSPSPTKATIPPPLPSVKATTAVGASVATSSAAKENRTAAAGGVQHHTQSLQYFTSRYEVPKEHIGIHNLCSMPNAHYSFRLAKSFLFGLLEPQQHTVQSFGHFSIGVLADFDRITSETMCCMQGILLPHGISTH